MYGILVGNERTEGKTWNREARVDWKLHEETGASACVLTLRVLLLQGLCGWGEVGVRARVRVVCNPFFQVWNLPSTGVLQSSGYNFRRLNCAQHSFRCDLTKRRFVSLSIFFFVRTLRWWQKNGSWRTLWRKVAIEWVPNNNCKI